MKTRPEILLHPQIPPPLHGLVPRVILGQEWWDKTRKAVAALTGGHCLACGVHKGDAKEHQWLEGHELYEIDYAAGRMTYIETVPLCHWCHNFIHAGRMQKNQMSILKLEDITEHGNKILNTAGLKKLKSGKIQAAQWADWRLVLFGQEYAPLCKSVVEWKKKYS